jgi:LysM repeat protein
MDQTGFTYRWMKRFRVLTLALIFSGALNIALLATLLFFIGQEQPAEWGVSPLAPPAAESRLSNISYLTALKRLHFRELVAQLTNREKIEEGYTKRDLALAVLTADQFFHLEKALGAIPEQRRPLHLSDGQLIELYPGLTDAQFDAVIRYAYQEKWPLTSKGLFVQLVRQGSGADETLTRAFCATPEFYALRVLFQKSGAAQGDALLLKLVSEGSWEQLETFFREQSQMVDLSADKRRHLLLSYRSSTAVELLLRTDFSYVLKTLDDAGVIDLLALLPPQGVEAKKFCSELLVSSRSDAVRERSAEWLYRAAGEVMPRPFNHADVVAHFALPQPRLTAESLVKQPPHSALPTTVAVVKKRTHTVKEGESLWKIARQYKVKVDALISSNHIEGERLFPGMELTIPDEAH